MQRTDIEWTDLSANPLKYRRPDGSTAWACVKVSPGCANCYSEAIGKRYNRAHKFNTTQMKDLTPFMDPKELREMLTRQTCQGLQVDGSRCFVGDMTDLFGPWVPFELLDQLFAVMALRSQVTFQILTKRMERAAEYSERIAEEPHLIGMALGDMLDGDWIHGPGRQFRKQIEQQINVWHGFEPDEQAYGFETVDPPWPLPNVWLGTSVENQAAADERREHLRNCPAAMRFVSYEPALQPVNWSGWEFVDQIISGGESGPNARPSHPACHRGARDFCTSHGIAYFFKQWGEWLPSDQGCWDEIGRRSRFQGHTFAADHQNVFRVGKKRAGRLLDGREWNEFPEVAHV